MRNSAHISLATNTNKFYKVNSKPSLLLQIDTLLDTTACLLDIEVWGWGLLKMEEGLALLCMRIKYSMDDRLLSLLL